nr:hypothetical protein [Streptomyces griseus]
MSEGSTCPTAVDRASVPGRRLRQALHDHEIALGHGPPEGQRGVRELLEVARDAADEGVAAVAEVRVVLDVSVGADVLLGGLARPVLVEGLVQEGHGGLLVAQFLSGQMAGRTRRRDVFRRGQGGGNDHRAGHEGDGGCGQGDTKGAVHRQDHLCFFSEPGMRMTAGNRWRVPECGMPELHQCSPFGGAVAIPEPMS